MNLLVLRKSTKNYLLIVISIAKFLAMDVFITLLQQIGKPYIYKVNLDIFSRSSLFGSFNSIGSYNTLGCTEILWKICAPWWLLGLYDVKYDERNHIYMYVCIMSNI